MMGNSSKSLLADSDMVKEASTATKTAFYFVKFWTFYLKTLCLFPLLVKYSSYFTESFYDDTHKCGSYSGNDSSGGRNRIEQLCC